jgi:hypothetical protein
LKRSLARIFLFGPVSWVGSLELGVGARGRGLIGILHGRPSFGTPLGTPTPKIIRLYPRAGGPRRQNLLLRSAGPFPQILSWGADLEPKRGRLAALFKFEIWDPSRDLYGNGPEPRKSGFGRQGPPTRGYNRIYFGGRGALTGLLASHRPKNEFQTAPEGLRKWSPSPPCEIELLWTNVRTET